MDELQQFICKQPCYEQHIVEVKKIYESRLFSILVPNIYEGFVTLYTIAEKLEQDFTKVGKNNPNVVKVTLRDLFKKLIGDLRDLSVHKIKQETERIKTSSRSAEIFDDLVRATIKSNIMLMTYNVDNKRKELIQTRYHESIIVHDFVHSCYIESGRVFYSKPELFWTGYPDITLCQNKEICYDIIRNAITESINMALPMKEILTEYLTNKYEQKDDIRVYVIGERQVGQEDYAEYPGNFGGNRELVDRGTRLGPNDEEFVRAGELLDRDLGVYIGENNGVESLLESSDDHFAPGPNLSVLLGSDSGTADSLLENDTVGHITPSDRADGPDATSLLEESENANVEGAVGDAVEGGSDGDKKTEEDPNAVIDGVRSVSLKTTMNGRGQAKMYFNEIMDEANNKADQHRQQVRENPEPEKLFSTKSEAASAEQDAVQSDMQSATQSGAQSATQSGTRSDLRSRGVTTDSDKSGIKITKTTDPKFRDAMVNVSDHQSPAQATESVDDMLNNILTR